MECVTKPTEFNLVQSPNRSNRELNRFNQLTQIEMCLLEKVSVDLAERYAERNVPCQALLLEIR